MAIVNLDKEIVSKLRMSELSLQMRSLESCEWLAIEEIDGKIIGAAGMGGLFHVSAIYINEKFRGRGIGKKLQEEIIKEAKRRNYSFITVFVDPRNISSVNLHDSLAYKTIFRIHYSIEIIQDIKILILKSRGYIISNLLCFFNTHVGIFFLACILKIIKSLLPSIISYNEEIIPNPSLRCIIKNFEKI